MTLLALGLNHQTAPLALREKVAIDPDATVAAVRDLQAQPGVLEAALLSTCNRTELYCRVDAGAEAIPARWLAQRSQLGPGQLDTYLYAHRDGEAARHLFRVATGLDSMVLGEPQILGQVKEAYQHARTAGGLKTPLDRLFQQTFAVAKRARTDTRIGAHPVSVAFAAVRLAQRVFTALDEATVLLIGAGDTIELAARHLVDQNVKRLLVANRTLEHAQTLASRFGGYALPLDELDRHLAEADIVISATAAREPVLRSDAVKRALRVRRHKPMFLLDLAVPRDIEASTALLDDVFLYTVDDLEQVIDENRRSRREAAEQAEAIIELQVEHYLAWWRATDQQDTLKHLRRHSEAERDAALARATDMLTQGRSPQQALEFLAHTLTNKLLHAPSANLRAAALRGDRDLLQAAARLFDHAAPASPDDDAPTSSDTDADDSQHSPQTRRAG